MPFHHIRTNLKDRMPLEQAVHLAVEDCIAQHILEDFLIKNRAEVESMVLSSFDQENHDRILKEAYFEQGKSALLEIQIQKKLERGSSVAEIADALEQDEETVRKIIDKIRQSAE